jgi:hypothetical protein
MHINVEVRVGDSARGVQVGWHVRNSALAERRAVTGSPLSQNRCTNVFFETGVVQHRFRCGEFGERGFVENWNLRFA